MTSPVEILKHWSITGPAHPSENAGLINQTFVIGEEPRAILQHVNPMFRPKIHEDIEAITAHLAQMGMLTPRLMRTQDGALFVEVPDGAWRILSFVPGSTIHTISSPEQAASAGALVGRFHAATASLTHTFQFSRPGAHDTHAHMAALVSALDDADGHALKHTIRPLGAAIVAQWKSWEGDLDLPLHICHGDLKISNLRFDHAQKEAICLLDFDTFGHQSLPVEMGDAWRSWCNKAGEDALNDIVFDLEIFEASARGWLGTAPAITQKERDNLVGGIERICLELAARFCTDAIRQNYFKEDRTRFAGAGEHNASRAEGQYLLGCSARKHRIQAEVIINTR